MQVASNVKGITQIQDDMSEMVTNHSSAVTQTETLYNDEITSLTGQYNNLNDYNTNFEGTVA